MNSRLGIFINRDVIYIENPSPEQVIENLRALNGESRSELTISSDAGYIVIHGSEYDRVKFYYALSDEWQKILNDPEPLQDERMMVITLNNGEIDGIPLNETISREQAIEVAVYFLEHGVLPEVVSETSAHD